jgi:hypothetical protein
VGVQRVVMRLRIRRNENGIQFQPFGVHYPHIGPFERQGRGSTEFEYTLACAERTRASVSGRTPAACVRGSRLLIRRASSTLVGCKTSMLARLRHCAQPRAGEEPRTTERFYLE